MVASTAPLLVSRALPGFPVRGAWAKEVTGPCPGPSTCCVTFSHFYFLDTILLTSKMRVVMYGRQMFPKLVKKSTNYKVNNWSLRIKTCVRQKTLLKEKKTTQRRSYSQNICSTKDLYLEFLKTMRKKVKKKKVGNSPSRFGLVDWLLKHYPKSGLVSSNAN